MDYEKKNVTSYQQQLEEYCKEHQLRAPVYQIVSDRRGGRTAWSATVTVEGRTYPARFWYDGQHINNAKEDAAEVALRSLHGGSQEVAEGNPNGGYSWLWKYWCM